MMKIPNIINNRPSIYYDASFYKLYIIPFRIEDVKSNGSISLNSARFAGTLNDKWCKQYLFGGFVFFYEMIIVYSFGSVFLFTKGDIKFLGILYLVDLNVPLSTCCLKKN